MENTSSQILVTEGEGPDAYRLLQRSWRLLAAGALIPAALLLCAFPAFQEAVLPGVAVIGFGSAYANILLVIGILTLALPLAKGFDLLRQLRVAEGRIQDLSAALETCERDLEAQKEELEWSVQSHAVANQRLEQASRRFQELFQGLPVACFCYDADGCIFEWNRACETLYGLRADEVFLKKIWEAIAPPEEQERIQEMVAGVFAGETFEGLEWEETGPDGEKRHILGNAFPLRGPDNSVLGGISANMDITRRKQAEEMIQWQAYHDTLTGLPNRALFQDRLEQALAMAERNGESSAVLFFDLDHFKRINDTLGHLTGDQLLQQVSRRLSNCLRTEDTLARMGGDEFTVLLPGIHGHDDAVEVAKRLLEALANPFKLNNHELFVTTSIGIALYPFDGVDVETLTKSADLAMYQAKAQGRNAYQLYTEALNASAYERLLLENSLRRAVERGELQLLYQPQVCLNHGRIVGVEALVRWRHPEMGLVSPDRFIPLAEETGLIAPLGEWVLEEACQQAAAWQAAGYELRMSVNLSARQFAQPGLAGRVLAVLKQARLDPEWLDLELTETALVENGEAAVEILRQLKKLGVRLSVDDFGTGYSSLSYLRRFPLDVLKVDRSFVKGLALDPEDQAVVRAVIDLAHALDLEVIAEGVETEGQRECLRALRCDTMQGYLFSPPIGAQEMEALLRNSGAPTPKYDAGAAFRKAA